MSGAPSETTQDPVSTPTRSLRGPRAPEAAPATVPATGATAATGTGSTETAPTGTESAGAGAAGAGPVTTGPAPTSGPQEASGAPAAAPVAEPSQETLSTTDPCPVCGEVPDAGARFCEGCGRPLGPEEPAALLPEAGGPAGGGQAPPGPTTGPEVRTDPDDPAVEPARSCTECGGTIAVDGYCELCGHPAADERDHWAERPATWVAGVCDRGRRHRRNEDAMAVAASDEPGRFAALVVCDGVSSAPDSDLASLAAARAARDVLVGGGPDGDAPVGGEPAERPAAWASLLGEAALAANDAITRTVGDKADRDDPPSCTFVAAVVDGPLVVAGWLGDSRAYWLPDAGQARRLTVDDSWAEEMVAQGMAREQAEASPQAHAITRWLGPDAHDLTVRCTPTRPGKPGWVLVCSDGLWNYCPEPGDLAALVQGFQADVGPDPHDLADALVRWANAQGGRDNITVTLARFDNLPETPDQPSASTTSTSAPGR